MSQLRSLNQYPLSRDEIIHIINSKKLHQGETERFKALKYKGKQLYLNDKLVIASEDIEELLKSIYNNPLTTHNSRDKLYDYVKERYVGISKVAVHDFLKRSEAYQLHYQNPKTKVINKPISNLVKGPLKILAIDLIDLQELSGYNNRKRYVLTCIDLFSKYAWAEPITNKTATSVRNAMERILDSLDRQPSAILSDNGSEFQNQFNSMLQLRNIKHIYSSSYAPQTNGAIEKFNKTLKYAIFHHLTQHTTKKYIDILPQILTNYNSTVHYTTNKKPIDLLNPEVNEMREVRQQNQEKTQRYLDETHEFEGHLQVGNNVRVSLFAINPSIRKTDKFRKKYLANWTKEIYRISAIIRPKQYLQRTQYKLKTLNDEKINKVFYSNQLLKIDIGSIIPVNGPHDDIPLVDDDNITTSLEQWTVRTRATQPIASNKLTRISQQPITEKRYVKRNTKYYNPDITN